MNEFTYIGTFVFVLAIISLIVMFRQNPKSPKDGAGAASGVVAGWYVLMGFFVILLPISLAFLTTSGRANWSNYLSVLSGELQSVTTPGVGGPGAEADTSGTSVTDVWPFDASHQEQGVAAPGAQGDEWAATVPGNDVAADAGAQQTAEEIARVQQLAQWRLEMDMYREAGDTQRARNLIEAIREVDSGNQYAGQIAGELDIAQARAQLRGMVSGFQSPDQLQDVVDALGPGTYRVVSVTDWRFDIARPFHFPTKWEEVSAIEDVTPGWNQGQRIQIVRGFLALLVHDREIEGSLFQIGQAQ